MVGSIPISASKCPRQAFWPVKMLSMLLTMLLLAMTSTVLAQTTAINGSIRGQVTDQSGASIADAVVTIKNSAQGVNRTMNTNADGYYAFPTLPLGSYQVTIKKDGFAAIQFNDVILQAGKEAVLDGRLTLGSVSTEVEVSGGAPIVEPSKVDVGRTIEERETQNLPLTSRNPYNFILFQPGVSGHPNPELGIPRTVNTNGLMDRINYQMDGMVDTETDRHGLRLFPISDVYVREIQTVSNSYAPEFGDTAGDIFNVITNSGSNDFHGSFQFIHRWVDATARPILLRPTQPKPDLRLDDYSANAGGKLIKDKLFWFGGYEHLLRGQPAPTTITAANAAALNLPATELAAAPGLEHAQFINGRLDWNISPKNQMFLRYNYFRNEFPFNTGVGGLNALSAESDFHDRAHVVGSQLVTTFSSNLLNEFRFSWSERNEKHVAGSLTGAGPQVAIGGVATFGGSTGVGDVFAEKIPNFNENLTWIVGKHTFKYGVGWQENVDTQTADTYTKYNFSSIAAYDLALSGANPFAYTSVTAQAGGAGYHYHSQFWDLYAQDSWQITPRLLVNYGLRWDKFVPADANPNAPFIYSQSFQSPSTNFAPRLGLAFRVDKKTVLRASAGMFYDPPATNTWYNTFVNNGINSTASLSATAAGAPAFPTLVASLAPAPGRIPDVWTVAPNYKDARTINGSLQLSREISNNDVVTVGYVYTGGRDLQFLRNMNLINPTGTLADGRPIFSPTVSAATRLYPQFNNIILQDVGANSSYNALLVTYNHRFSAGIEANAAYTWSHSISNAPDANGFEQNLLIEDTTNVNRDRGNSSINRPQALTLSAVLEPQFKVSNSFLKRLANDNMLTIASNISSGDEQNIITSTVLNGDPTTSSVTRPLFVGRNSLRAPAIYQIDMRYTRTFATLWERLKPQFFIEANNVFNHPNVTSLNVTVPVTSTGAATYGPSFGTPLSTVLEGRIVQIGLAARW